MSEAIAEFFPELQSGTKRREPAKGGQGTGHILLLPFLGCARKGSRLAGRNPPVLTFSLELMDSEQSQGRWVATPLAAILFCHATKEYAEKGTRTPYPSGSRKRTTVYAGRQKLGYRLKHLPP